MAAFLMFGKYSPQAMQGMSAQRTREVVGLIEQNGGKAEAMYATLGEHDLVFVLSFPDNQAAMKASVAASQATGIAFSTAPAVSVDEFDKLMG